MNEFKKGDRVTHKYGSIMGEATVVFLPNEVGYEDSNAYGIRYDGWHYGKRYTKSPDGLDFHTAIAESLAPVEVEEKMFTTTTIATRHEWANQDRVVSVTSGRGGVSLSVWPNPHLVGDVTGTTGLTPEQAEQLALDLLARVEEIRKGEGW